MASTNQITDIINIFVVGALIIAFVLGGIGIMNIMLMASVERRREIGISMAFGARTSRIQFQFLLESLWITLLGVCGGILCGTFTGLALHAMKGYPWATQVSDYVFFILGGTLISLVFGMYPSLQVTRVNPAEAIRK